MPAIIALLLRGLVWLVSTYAGQWVLKIMLSLGIGLVSHTVAAPALMSFVQSKASGLSLFVFQAFGAIGGDVAFSMIISATVAAVTGNMIFKALAK